jgi:hypothetical protein
MATLYRPKVTTYTLPDGSYRTPDGERVTSKTPGAVRTVTKSKTWFGRYTDGAGKRHQVKLSASKETARRMLAKLAGDAQLAGVGIVGKYAEHRARSLTGTQEKPGHLEDYGRYLAGKGNTAEYVPEAEVPALEDFKRLPPEEMERILDEALGPEDENFLACCACLPLPELVRLYLEQLGDGPRRVV